MHANNLPAGDIVNSDIAGFYRSGHNQLHFIGENSAFNEKIFIYDGKNIFSNSHRIDGQGNNDLGTVKHVVPFEAESIGYGCAGPDIGRAEQAIRIECLVGQAGKSVDFCARRILPIPGSIERTITRPFKEHERVKGTKTGIGDPERDCECIQFLDG